MAAVILPLSIDSVAVHREPSLAFEALSKTCETALERWHTAVFELQLDCYDVELRRVEAERRAHYQKCSQALADYVVAGVA